MISKDWIRTAKTYTAITLSFCLLGSSVDFADVTTAFQSIKPTEELFALPPHLGTVTDRWASTPSPQSKNSGLRTQDSGLVILIQDLHAHYGAQKNIAGILEFLAKKLPKT